MSVERGDVRLFMKCLNKFYACFRDVHALMYQVLS